MDFGKFSQEYFGEKKQTGFELDTIKTYNRKIHYEINKLTESNESNHDATNQYKFIQSVDILFSFDTNLGLGVLLEFTEKFMGKYLIFILEQHLSFLLETII